MIRSYVAAILSTPAGRAHLDRDDLKRAARGNYLSHPSRSRASARKFGQGKRCRGGSISPRPTRIQHRGEV